MTSVIDSLWKLCLECCIDSPFETLTGNNYTPKRHQESYYTAAFIPSSLCNLLVRSVLQKHPEHFLQIFIDTNRCRLTELNLSTDVIKYPTQDQKIIAKLLRHPLRTLSLVKCQLLPLTLTSIQNCSNTLLELDLSFAPNVTSCFLLKELKQLKKLNVQGTDIAMQKNDFHILGQLQQLSWLNLSMTLVDNSCLEVISSLKNLTWLSLYNCIHITNEKHLCKFLHQLNNLHHLDLSKDFNDSEPNDDLEPMNENHNPTISVYTIKTLSMLPNLISLDISGSTGLVHDDMMSLFVEPKKLRFLGLCKTGLSSNINLPLTKVTGEANEEQVLASLEIYHDRPKYILVAMRKLFIFATNRICVQLGRCMRNIIKCMEIFPNNNAVHIAATASLYHMTREDDPANTDRELRRSIILAVLDSMTHLTDLLQLQKNCCLTLCNFQIPDEVEFSYFRIAEVLLIAVKKHHDDYLRRIAVLLFNHIVCQNANNPRKEIGMKGAIKILLNVIREKMTAETRTDTLLNTLWSSLWNITDETPENCREFLNTNGMRLCLDCLYLFPNGIELHRNAMGLMGNIAEVGELRERLMSDDYVKLFVTLLDGDKGLEVSYNAAGILSHMLGDGVQAWSVTCISRERCMQCITDSIYTWNLNAIRNINYRSFKPILKLLHCFHAPAAQLWAVWALANLTRVYPFKYCKLVVDENGCDHLNELLGKFDGERLRLAEIVLTNCREELCI